MISPVTVVGGAGRVGSRVVAHLTDAGSEVRVVSRRARPPAPVRDGLVVFQGDVREPADLVAPMAGAAAVLISVEPGTASTGANSPKATVFDGVRNVLSAATPQLRRIVLVSQIYATRSGHPMNAAGGLLDWRLAGEDLVRASGIPYTVVRPSWLVSGHGRVRLEQGDVGDGQVGLDDVAEACFRALGDPAAIGRTFEIYGDGAGTNDWSALFAGLRVDAEPAQR